MDGRATQEEGRAFCSADELRDFVERASTIQERQRLGYSSPLTVDDSERVRIRSRLEEWRKSATGGDEELFAQWLRVLGIHDPTSLLSRIRVKSDQPLPAWALAFAWTMPAMSEPADIPLPGRNESDHAVPFEDLLWPVVCAAWRKLEQQVGTLPLQRWSNGARLDLQRGLLRRLARRMVRPLYAEFISFRYLWHAVASNFQAEASPAESRTIYEEFVVHWRSDRCRAFFQAKPVAARLLGTTVSLWLEATAELCERLQNDWDRLERLFAPGERFGIVTSVLPDRSDPHCGGRTVAILQFSNGRSIVYKPKDLRVDLAWASLIRWFEKHGSPLGFRTVPVLARGAYGWTAYVSAAADIEHDSAEFYRRAGGLLAVFYLLRGSDFHDENVIRSVNGPIPVDLETLLSPDCIGELYHGHADPAITAAAELIRNSVLVTHYLPGVRRQVNGTIEAFGGIQAAASPVRNESWEFHHINTDAMEICSRRRSEAAVESKTATARLATHTEDIVVGFSEMYRFFLQQKNELADPAGPLRAFRRVRVRVLLEDTGVYGVVAAQAAGVRNLADGADWSIRFDLLAGHKNPSADLHQRIAIHAAEVQALANCDIPFFTARADSDAIESGNDRIEHVLTDTPFNQTLRHVGRFNSDDHAFQVRLIRKSLLQPLSREQRPVTTSSISTDDGALIAEAVRFGELLVSAAVRDGGSAAWIGPAAIDHDHWTVRVAGIDLYSGAIGIALFLAALARVTGDARFRNLAIEALRPMRVVQTTSRSGVEALRSLGIGGACGLGSVVYGKLRIGKLLQLPSAIEEAQSIADMLDDDLIAADRSHDVINGAAGAILSLLALFRENGDRTVLERAVSCGEHLLRERIRADDGNTGWQTLSDTTAFLTGFSHGASGIALALLRLYQTTGQTRFQEAAFQALAYEKRVFIPAVSNWPDLRPQARNYSRKPLCQWCHGAAGIGLARVGCLEIVDDPEILSDFEMALTSTINAKPSELDHVCCGNFGRIEFLLSAGLKLNRKELVALARNRAAQRIEQQAITFSGSLGGAEDEIFNPSFFQGISGIGYVLLRLTAPDLLPSVLLWD